MYNTFIISREHLDKYWRHVENYLSDGLLMCENELNIHQMRLLISQGALHLVVIIDPENDYIKGAAVFELVNYPNYRAANIVSYGGYNLFLEKETVEAFKAQLRLAGISVLQGWCKPAQARLFKREYGFQTPYEMIRMSTEGE